MRRTYAALAGVLAIGAITSHPGAAIAEGGAHRELCRLANVDLIFVWRY